MSDERERAYGLLVQSFEEEQQEDRDPNAQHIVFCPVCCTTVDAEGEGVQELDCNHCGQVWVMNINSHRFDEHSIN